MNESAPISTATTAATAAGCAATSAATAATAAGCAAAATVLAITFEEKPTVLSLPMPPRASDEFHRRFFNHHPRKRKAEVKPEPEKRAKTEPHHNERIFREKMRYDEDEECVFHQKMRTENRLLARADYTGVPSIDW